MESHGINEFFKNLVHKGHGIKNCSMEFLDLWFNNGINDFFPKFKYFKSENS